MLRLVEFIVGVWFLKTYGFGNAFDLDEAHATIASHGQTLVVAESWNLNTGFLARLINSVSSVDLRAAETK